MRVDLDGTMVTVTTAQFLEALFRDGIFPVLDENARVALIGHEEVPRKMMLARRMLNAGTQLEAECVIALVEKRVPGWDIAKDQLEERQAMLAAEGLPDDATSAALALVQGWQPGQDRVRVLPSTKVPKKPSAVSGSTKLVSGSTGDLMTALPLPFPEAVRRFGADAVKQAAKAGKIIAEADGEIRRAS